MIHTIRVQVIKGPDLLGQSLLHDFKTFLGDKRVTDIKTVKVYRLEDIQMAHAKLLAEKLFAEQINQTYTINKPLITNTKTLIEIGYKPGVMNPEVASIIKAAKDLHIPIGAVDTSREFAFYGNVSKEHITSLVNKINLFNKLIEHIVDKEPKTLKISGTVGKTETIALRNMSDQELLVLSQDKLFLTLEEMKVIQKYFQGIKRDPTDCEIETLAQTWSEHSGHKTFKAIITIDGKEKMPFIKRIQKEALKHKKHIVSAFVDNSGVMDFFDGYAICGKAETHNSPSAIEPYGGAMTGSGGVFRDIVGTGLGAKALVSTDIFCLAPPEMDLKKLPPGCLPPRYMLKRVVAAVRDYGNRIGIPTNNGSFHFHEDFRAKPTVLVGSYGILPKKMAQKGIPKTGDCVVSIGGRVGRDGIHGATFSSGEMTDRTISVNSQAVQIGNAIEEKRAFDAILEARDKGLIRAIQDSGGGGLSSAVGEMGSETGVKVQLKNARLKYPGLSPWEIWLSESQERMILAIAKSKLSAFKKICKKYNVEVSELGEFTHTKKLQVYYGKELVCDMSMDFLHHGLPQRKMTARKKPNGKHKTIKTPLAPTNEKEWVETIKKIVAHGNVASKEPIVRMYDHSVQGTNDLQPFSGVNLDAPNDAAIVRPLLGKPYGMVVSHGLNPVLNTIDPYWGSVWAGVEALANYVVVGGNYKQACLINNYVWPFPDEESLWTLDRCVDAVIDLMKTFKIPVISGKDSLSSTYRGKDGSVLKIPPVLAISVFGRIKDTAKTQTADFKKTNSTIVLVGALDKQSLGGSIYYDIHNLLGETVPKPDLKTLPKVFQSLHKGITTGKILAAHDVSEGGVITTLFEMCLGGNCGAVLTIKDKYPHTILFNETAGTFLVEVANDSVAKKLFADVPYTILGTTQKEKTISAKKLFDVKLDDLTKAWKKPMQTYF